MHRVLIVEDDPQIRDIMYRYLTIQKYHVIVARDGAEGVRVAAEQLPDIILMDMGLPILDGWQATQRLKSDEATRSIPIIALTAFAMSEDRLKSLDVGCDAFESKPVQFDRLLATMVRLIASGEQARGA